MYHKNHYSKMLYLRYRNLVYSTIKLKQFNILFQLN